MFELDHHTAQSAILLMDEYCLTVGQESITPANYVMIAQCALYMQAKHFEHIDGWLAFDDFHAMTQ